MSSISLFEQLTSSVSLSVLGIVSTAVLILLLVYTVACRLFFALSTSKTKDCFSNEEKRPNTKNQQRDQTSSKKKKNGKTKKTTAALSSPSARSERSDNEKTKLVVSTKQSTTAGRKATAAENNKASASVKQQQAPVRAEHGEERKQLKTGRSTKQQTSGKGQSTTCLEAKCTPTVDDEVGGDYEDGGQWVTLGSKQVNNRNRNKGKPETTSSTLTNPDVVSATKSLVTVPSTNGDTSSLTDNLEPLIPNEEPIEICQLFAKIVDPYTANDNWWKEPLNKQQTFSVDDIGEWPEREEEEEYTMQIKRIIPVKKSNEEQNTHEQVN